MKLNDFKVILNDFDTHLYHFSNDTIHNTLKESMLYSLSNGGKRVRPLLLLATIQAFNGNVQDGMLCAKAIEYIHTYSLIHDDLPAMDNDDYRRGQLTNHKQFDEATAILAGDALLTDAFLHVSQSNLSDAQKVAIMQQLSLSAGSIGMINGQFGDIRAEGQRVSLETLQTIHHLKTGQLLQFCVYAGCVISDVSIEIRTQLVQFATHFGLAFQIHNDILDIAQDEQLEKSTYVSLLSLDGAKQALQNEVKSAKQCLQRIKTTCCTFDDELLADFLQFVTL